MKISTIKETGFNSSFSLNKTKGHKNFTKSILNTNGKIENSLLQSAFLGKTSIVPFLGKSKTEEIDAVLHPDLEKSRTVKYLFNGSNVSVSYNRIKEDVGDYDYNTPQDKIPNLLFNSLKNMGNPPGDFIHIKGKNSENKPFELRAAYDDKKSDIYIQKTIDGVESKPIVTKKSAINDFHIAVDNALKEFSSFESAEIKYQEK